MLSVVVYHAIFMYNAQGISVGTLPDTTGAHYQDAVEYLLYPWFMLILFIIAGISSRLYLEKHTAKQYIRSRTDKLLVPSTLGLFVWCWAQGWISMKISELNGSDVDMSAAPGFVKYLIMVLSGQSVLWFIQLLWLFSLAAALINRLEKGKLYSLCEKINTPALILFVVPLFFAGLVLNTPVITVYRFGYYGFGFLLGYFVFAHEEVIDRLRRYRFILLGVSLALGITYTILYFGQNYADASAHIEVINSPAAVAYAWTAVLAIFACAREWFDKETAFTKFMTKKSFGVYMFHFIGISAAAYLMAVYLNVPLFVRYIAVLLAGLAAGFGLQEVFGRIPLVRYLVMGIRAKKKTAE